MTYSNPAGTVNVFYTGFNSKYCYDTGNAAYNAGPPTKILKVDKEKGITQPK